MGKLEPRMSLPRQDDYDINAVAKLALEGHDA